MKLRTSTRKATPHMGFIRVEVRLRDFSSDDIYQSEFLVDTGATDSMVPASELKKIGVTAVGKMTYELANDQIEEYPFGLAEISFMNETTAGRVIFGPDNIEPILGVTALESAGIIVDPANQQLKRLPAIPLK
ncbi:MAG TPA: retroviral-like aspartic protease family protein [Pyrinomonadaceae bacterium]